MDGEKFVIYDRWDYVDPDDEYHREWFDQLAEDEGREIGEDERLQRLGEERDLNFREDVAGIDRALSSAGSDPRLLVYAFLHRWDGEGTRFERPVGSLAELVEATGRGEVFEDCEIVSVWDEGGRLFVSGAHHDSGTTPNVVEARLATPALARRFEEAYEEGDRAAMFACWEEAVPPHAAYAAFGAGTPPLADACAAARSKASAAPGAALS